jgi:hypothetical protein
MTTTDDFTPVNISTTEEAPPVEMVPLFTIDDEVYEIPKLVPPKVVMQYLRDITDQGLEVALARATRTILGEDAMQALSDCETVKPEQMGAIFKVVARKLLATSEGMAGKSSRAQRRSRG